MGLLQPVPIPVLDPRRFESLISDEEYRALLSLIDRAATALKGRVIWNVNSTSSGGGVAELLRSLLGYSRGGGVDARWLVIAGGPGFFGVTKRIHNHLHGFDRDKAGLSDAERSIYEGTLAENAAQLIPLLHRQDIVILHDPQTAGLVDAVRSTGAGVIWRCHVGTDGPNSLVRKAWRFLCPYVLGADAYVFSRAAFAWDGLDRNKVSVIHPSIDAFSPKNQELTRAQSLSILSRAGIIAGPQRGEPTFTRGDGTPGRVDRRADVLEVVPLSASDRLVVQVSRWDSLKDPVGVMSGFTRYIADRTRADLVLAGPAMDTVADDPEGTKVFGQVRDAWHALPPRSRRRVHLVSLPMADGDENAAIVNALQRQAAVVVQKSLGEGFGLTVAEAMWKGRAVVASAVGGIQDQIVDGECGVLLPDPRDLVMFGDAVVDVLKSSDQARRMGIMAHERIQDEFLAPQHLGRHFELIDRVLSAQERDGDVGAKQCERLVNAGRS